MTAHSEGTSFLQACVLTHTSLRSIVIEKPAPHFHWTHFFHFSSPASSITGVSVLRHMKHRCRQTSTTWTPGLQPVSQHIRLGNCTMIQLSLLWDHYRNKASQYLATIFLFSSFIYRLIKTEISCQSGSFTNPTNWVLYTLTEPGLLLYISAH